MFKFDKYFLKEIQDSKEVSYIETFYFNYGVWQEVYEEGIFTYTSSFIKNNLIHTLKTYGNLFNVLINDDYKIVKIDLKKYEGFCIDIVLKM